MSVRIEYVDGPGAASLRITSRDLAALPTEIRGRLRPALTAAGTVTLRRAQANASWSTRIPRALSLQVSFAKGNAGVTIVADVGAAPHARAYEGIVAPTFKHPVFDREAGWVTQAARPYLRPAAQETGAEVVDLIRRAVDDALTTTGF